MELRLPKEAEKAVQKYTSLPLGGEEIQCPYYINISNNKDLRVMVGKGNPEEIIVEAKIWAKLKSFNFETKSPDEIKKFLQERGIGIDCSGFVVHVLNSWYKHETGKNIWQDLKILRKGLRAKIGKFFRPVEQLGANTLTSEINSSKVELNDVLPGDVIRSKWKRQNSHHIILISSVVRSDKGILKKIGYFHSTPFFGEKSGVRFGEIEINNPNLPLESQKWLETDKNGHNPTFEGYMINVKDNGIRRLKPLAGIQQDLYGL